ncbi:MAG: CapA family protein [Eubacteriales bacterium]|nr:CapA family protein [Eubacteriales bacterium]
MVERYANILFLGDIMAGENLYHLGRGIRTKYGHNYKDFIPDSIKKELFEDIDAVVYNFEYSLAPDDFNFDDFESSIYSSTVSSLDIIPESIVRIVNIANNHFWERGPERTKFTIAKLKEKGFVVAGENNTPTIISIHDAKLFFWGCSLIDWDVPIFTANYSDLLSKLSLPQQKIDGDIWIMSIHWGTEFITYPDKEQVELAHNLINSGFDIIHGHHPHVFQPIEIYRNSLIMYSMGNFVFDENFSVETQKSYCLKINTKNLIEPSCDLIHNKYYKPYSIRRIDPNKILIKKDHFWSVRRKRIVAKTYNLCRKFEFLLHIWENNFYVYKSMKKRLAK